MDESGIPNSIRKNMVPDFVEPSTPDPAHAESAETEETRALTQGVEAVRVPEGDSKPAAERRVEYKRKVISAEDLQRYNEETDRAILFSTAMLVKGYEDESGYKPWSAPEVAKAVLSVQSLLESKILYQNDSEQPDAEKIEEIQKQFETVRDFKEELETAGDTVPPDFNERLRDFSKSVVGPFPEFKKMIDSSSKVLFESFDFSVREPLKELSKIPDLTAEQSQKIEDFKGRSEELRDRFLDLIGQLRGSSVPDGNTLLELNAITADIQALGNDVERFSKESSKSFFVQEKLKAEKELLIFQMIGTETIDPLPLIKRKVEERIDDCASLLGSLETLAPEETAKHFAEYYFPVIEIIRDSESLEDIQQALNLLDISDMWERFEDGYIKKKGFVSTKEVKAKVGNGSFPFGAFEIKAFAKIKEDLKRIIEIDGILEE